VDSKRLFSVAQPQPHSALSSQLLCLASKLNSHRARLISLGPSLLNNSLSSAEHSRRDKDCLVSSHSNRTTFSAGHLSSSLRSASALLAKRQASLGAEPSEAAHNPISSVDSRLSLQSSGIHFQLEPLYLELSSPQQEDCLEQLNSSLLLVDFSGQLHSQPQEEACLDSNRPGNRTRCSEPSLSGLLPLHLFSAELAHNLI